MPRKTTATFASSLCGLALLLTSLGTQAWNDAQACVDKCLSQENKLRCLRECSVTESAQSGLNMPKDLPQSVPAEVPETDFLRQMMAQAAAACKQGNKQACRNLEAMKAGK